MVGPDRIPIPALLATAAVHHHLIRKGLRTSVGLVVETGEAREVHHFACLAGYGAEAINPYLAFETLTAMAKELPEAIERLRGRQALHQVDRQGPAEGHVEDGHLDLPVLLRRADFRRGRPVARVRRPHSSSAPRPRSRAPALPEIARGDGAPPSRRVRRFAGLSQRARSRRRIRLPAARRGPCLDAARRSRCCSTPCAATRRTSIAPSPSCSTSRSEQLLTIRGLFRIKTRGGGRARAGAARGGRAGRGRSSSASRPARCRSARSRARRIRRSPSP